MLSPTNYHVVAEVDPPVGVDRYELKLQLDGGGIVTGRVVDPAGKSVEEFYYLGRLAQLSGWRPSKGDVFELVGYQPDSPRRVFFADRQHNLAGSAKLTGELPKDLVVTLQNAGSVRGRLVDKDGSPLANYQLIPWSPPISSPADMAVRDGSHAAATEYACMARWQI